MNVSPDDAAISAPRIFVASRPACCVLPLAMLFGASLVTLADHHISLAGSGCCSASLADASLRARPDTSGSSGHIPRRVSSRCFFPLFYSAFCFSRSFFFFGGSFFPIACRCCLQAASPREEPVSSEGSQLSFLLRLRFCLARRRSAPLGRYRTCRGYPTVRFSFVSADTGFRSPRSGPGVCRGSRPAAFS